MTFRKKIGDNILIHRSTHKIYHKLYPSKIIDTKLVSIDGPYKFNVFWKCINLPSPWISKTPRRYKRNTVKGDFDRSKRISSNFDKEILLTKEMVIKADYQLRFTNSVIKG